MELSILLQDPRHLEGTGAVPSLAKHLGYKRCLLQ